MRHQTHKNTEYAAYASDSPAAMFSEFVIKGLKAQKRSRIHAQFSSCTDHLHDSCMGATALHGKTTKMGLHWAADKEH
jgi:hypothetical protein